MKKFYYLLGVMTALLLTVMACEKSSVGDELQMFKKGDVLLKKGVPADKVTICHYDNYLEESYQITISENGLKGHDGSGTEPRHTEDNFEPIDADVDGIMDCADCALGNNDLAASMKKMWYQDLDGDSYGNPDVYIKTCLIRDGYVADNTDCDDTVYIFTPEGTYTFGYTDGITTYNHTFTINFFDGLNFTGTGYYNVGFYPYEIAGTVIDGVLEGDVIDPNVTDREFHFSGLVGDCGGILSLDSTVYSGGYQLPDFYWILLPN